MSDIPLKVVIEDAYLEETETVSRDLEAAGLVIEVSIPEIGVIFGSAEEGLIQALRETKGVRDAVPEGKVQLPPISEKIPQ